MRPPLSKIKVRFPSSIACHPSGTRNVPSTAPAAIRADLLGRSTETNRGTSPTPLFRKLTFMGFSESSDEVFSARARFMISSLVIRALGAFVDDDFDNDPSALAGSAG